MSGGGTVDGPARSTARAPARHPAGRRAELEMVLTLAEQAQRTAEARVAVVTGDAGMGKTTMLDALASALPDAAVMRGECLDIASARLPYAPIVQAVRASLRHPDAWGLTLGTPARRVLGRLVPEVAAPLEASDAGDADLGHTQLYEHLLRVVEQAAAHSGLLLLLVEDVHWCDPATADLLTFLVGNLTDSPVLTVLTGRADEIDRTHPVHPLLTGVRRSGRARLVELGPLDDASVAELVADALLDRDDLPRVLDRCGGNPLHALQLAAGHGEVTDTLADLLLDRVDRCPSSTRRVLEIVAAAGGEQVTHRLVEAMAGLDGPALDLALRDAVSAGLLVATDDGYRFRHALIADAVDEATLPHERQRLHGAIADLLLSEGGPEGPYATRLARHLRITGRRAEELSAAHAAALRARDAFGYRDAVAGLERVAELWPTVADSSARTGTDLAGVYELAAACAEADIDPTNAVRYAELALASFPPDVDPTRVALAHKTIARGLELDWPRALAAFQQALAALPDGDSPARATITAAFCSRLTMEGRFGEAVAMAEEAIEVARRVGPCAAEAEAIISLATVRGQQGMAEEAAALFADGQAVAAACGSVHQQMRGAVNRSGILANQGAFDDAIEECNRAIAIAVDHGLDRTWGMDLRVNLLGPLVDSGRFAEALAIGMQAIPVAPAGSTRAGLMTQTGMAAVRSGDLPLARRLMEDAKAAMGGSQQTWFVAFWGQLAAELALAEGDVETARVRVGEALEAVTNPDGSRFWAGEVGALVADVVRAAGGGEDLGEVIALVRRAAADGETRIHAGERLRLEAIDAQLRGRPPEEVEAAWRRALEVYESLPMPERIIRCQLALAQLAVEGGDRRRGQELLAEAARRAESIGAGLLAERAGNLATRWGVAAIGGGPVASSPVAPVHEGPPEEDRRDVAGAGVWRRTGAGWTVAFEGHETVLADAKGVRDLATLLANAGREVHVFDLTGGGVIAQQLPVLDEVAKRRYAHEAVALEEEIADAEAAGDDGRAAEASERREWIVDQLRAAAGLAGRTRRSADGEERARQAVGARIRYTLARLEECHPALGAHLRDHVRLGVRCVYDPGDHVEWDVSTS
nr:AAA family ATPase [Euzebya rosea]